MDGTTADIQEAELQEAEIRERIKHTIDMIAGWDPGNVSSANYAAAIDNLFSLYEKLKNTDRTDSDYQDGFEAGYVIGWIDCEKGSRLLA